MFLEMKNVDFLNRIFSKEYGLDDGTVQANLLLALGYVSVLFLIYVLFYYKKNGGFQAFVKKPLFLLTVLGGLAIYYIGYSINEVELHPIFKGFLALFSTARLFILGNDLVEVHEKVNVNYYIWFSVFSVSAALISTSIIVNLVGKSFKSWFKVFLSRPKEVYLFFGLNKAGYALAKDIKFRNSDALIAFVKNVMPDEHKELENMVEELDAILLNSNSFFSSLNLHNEEFSFQPPHSEMDHSKILDKLNIRGWGLERKIMNLPTRVFFLSDNENQNFYLSQIFVDEIKKYKRVNQIDVHIRTLSGNMENIYDGVLDKKNQNILVHLHNQSYISASQLAIENLPIKWIKQIEPECIKAAKVNRNFTVIIVGFGYNGSAALRKLYENGRFLGSKFKAILIDQNMQEREGEIKYRYQGLVDDLKDSLEFHCVKANSMDYYRIIEKYANVVDYFVVTLGNDELNIKIAHDIKHVMQKIKTEYRIFAQVSGEDYFGQKLIKQDGTIQIFGRDSDVFTENIIIKGHIERIAKNIHKYYNDKKIEEKRKDWNQLSKFLQNSNISVAEHAITKLLLAGFNAPINESSDYEIVRKLMEFESYEKIEESLGKDTVDNLGKNEHLRWNAFHYANGWTTWPLKEIPEDAKENKNEEMKMHACLVDWETLDAVSTRFDDNYKQYDLDCMKDIYKNIGLGLYDEVKNSKMKKNEAKS